MDCTWLPSLINYEHSVPWIQYEESLFRIFKKDFIDTKPLYNNKHVKIRWNPVENGKPEAFYHVTCCDYEKNGNRSPDFRRCERIRWIRKFIENRDCMEMCTEVCDGILVLPKTVRGTQRIHLLLEKERYIVVIEPRNQYNLLITAYYIEYEHTLRKLVNEYVEYKAKGAS